MTRMSPTTQRDASYVPIGMPPMTPKYHPFPVWEAFERGMGGIGTLLIAAEQDVPLLTVEQIPAVGRLRGFAAKFATGV